MKHNKIVLLAKSKLNGIEVLLSKVLTDSKIRQYGFLLINNVMKEYDDIKEEMKTSNDTKKFKLYIKQCCLIV